ncbi:XRE family transcriptional regulator [Salmonella enterica subsp. enterica]|nr:XRE family transcriptional regulator [Salmonella enterica subsp. enterica serovar Duisburg]EAX8251741.1 helix-turn-helix transcriptional regulator [Salmonella enterica]
MITLSIDYAEKLKQIRLAEHLTQQQFSDLTGVSYGFLKQYESGHKPARSDIAVRVLQCNLFEKYTMWLLHGKTFPHAGQIAPVLSLDGSIQSEGNQASIETPLKSPRSRSNAG